MHQQALGSVSIAVEASTISRVFEDSHCLLYALTSFACLIWLNRTEFPIYPTQTRFSMISPILSRMSTNTDLGATTLSSLDTSSETVDT